jgi:pyruvate dehydrogenase E2 component (dihydrolipoamide acetyltransferase)
MAKEFLLPELGENIESGALTQLLVSPGDSVQKDQPLLELETDKAVIEVPSNLDGVIQEILVTEGDEIKVGQKLMIIQAEIAAKKDIPADKEEIGSDSADEGGQKPVPEKKVEESSPTSSTKSRKEARAEKRIFTLPELGENVESGSVTKILVSVGDQVSKDQSILELETEKAVVEIPVDITGNVQKIFIEEGNEIKVGQPILELQIVATSPMKEQTLAAEEPEVTPDITTFTDDQKPEELIQPKFHKLDVSRERKEVVPAAPSVRRFSREIGIDIGHVPGTGPGGRISIDDVKNYSRTLTNRQSSSTAPFNGIEAESLPDFSKWGVIDPQPMSKVREKTARHLAYAWATIPHVTQFDKADITRLEKVRKQYSKQVENTGGKLTMTAIILKIIGSALRKFPQFNASADMENSKIIFKKYINVGIAVDTDRGLLVPVVRHVDQKNIRELSVEIAELAQKARDKKLSLEEMQGGNFSISNLGGIGGTAFTPVVNSPEVAILGVSRGEMQQVYIDGEFRPRLMLPLALSYDHRIIDGADAARFLRWVAESIENPFKILLEG